MELTNGKMKKTKNSKQRLIHCMLLLIDKGLIRVYHLKQSRRSEMISVSPLWGPLFLARLNQYYPRFDLATRSWPFCSIYFLY